MDGFSGEIADDAGQMLRSKIHLVGVKFDTAFGAEILAQ